MHREQIALFLDVFESQFKYPDVSIQCGSSFNLDVNAEFYPLCADCENQGSEVKKKKSEGFQAKIVNVHIWLTNLFSKKPFLPSIAFLSSKIIPKHQCRENFDRV